MSSEIPNWEIVIPALLQHSVLTLSKHCHLTPGIPLKPMLAHPTRSISEVLNRFEGVAFTCEFKYDGERAQIHCLPDGSISIFSRNCENLTAKYPDIQQAIKRHAQPSTSTFVIDCEVVAWDAATGKLLPFQVLTTRKRKEVQQVSIEVQVALFAFDCLFLNGESLLQRTLRERRACLHAAFREQVGEFSFAASMNATATEEIAAFLEEAIGAGCEGLMVKTLDADSAYEPSKRCRKWLKVKKDYVDGLAGDSLDLVVIGGYVGRGKRVGGYGGFLLACYDPDAEEYQAICKIGTGFSDCDLAAAFATLSQRQLSQPKPYVKVTEGCKPDVWFEPCLVWEVRAADFSLSPLYPAAMGLVDSGRGISLRFPRFIRLREDKAPEQATSSEQIAYFYRSQASIVAPQEDLDY